MENNKILAIGGGKGGVGKSFVASNLGILLAQSGSKVILADLD
ncbi:MAG: P-loop NTPase, partial [Deltaproteobacteria bacterium]|nr:P-loop NTPase [Deltaproteobacteria bacterium]